MTAAARFAVRGTWWFASRRFWVVYGDVESGVIQMGMTARMGDGFEAPVDLIESMLASGTSSVALGFRPGSRLELERWRAQAWEDGVIGFATDEVLHPCPCCAFRTMREAERASYDICPVCGWEDDLVQFHDPDFRGGANVDSLNEYRRDFGARYTEEFP